MNSYSIIGHYVKKTGWTAEDYAQFGGHQDLIDLLKVQKKEETNLDQSDKLSVQSSDPSENCFEVIMKSN